MRIEFYHTFQLPDRTIEGQWDLNPIAPNLEKIDVAGKTVLDIACRDGWYGFNFEKRGAKVTGLDLDNRAARRYMKKVLGSQNEFIHANGYSLHTLPEKSFDVTFTGDVLCHLQDPMRFLRNIHHVTKDVFYLVADNWEKFALWHKGYPFMFTEKEIMTMLEWTGFRNNQVIDRFVIKGDYWRRRGCKWERNVSLIKCHRDQNWQYGTEEGIVPQSGTDFAIQELTYEINYEEA